ncbi:MAG: GDP-mannose 4,6-dehydratase [Candidatus Heimdallarchaeota archaeon]|nr:GDP-mannose 4,6-dehydratase [Candidatus Heimdallarchaeota archaeon]
MSEFTETVLITGGLGQVGYYTYLQLKENYNICIIDNMSSSKSEVPEDVFFVKNDIQNKECYSNLPDIDYIIHTAAQISVSKSVANPVFDAENNIVGTLRLLDYAIKSKVKRFVHISSAATYGQPQFLPITEEHPRNPISPYGLSKLVSEKYVRLYSSLHNLDTVVIIPFNIYSPLQHADDPYAGVIYQFINAIKHGEQFTIYGDGNQTRDFTHVSDVAYAIELALKEKKAANQVINIGSGIPYSINELSNTLLNIANSKLHPLHSDARDADIDESYCSIKRAQDILGYVQTTSIENGLSEMFEKI